MVPEKPTKTKTDRLTKSGSVFFIFDGFTSNQGIIQLVLTWNCGDFKKNPIPALDSPTKNNGQLLPGISPPIQHLPNTVRCSLLMNLVAKLKELSHGMNTTIHGLSKSPILPAGVTALSIPKKTSSRMIATPSSQSSHLKITRPLSSVKMENSTMNDHKVILNLPVLYSRMPTTTTSPKPQNPIQNTIHSDLKTQT